MRPHRLWIFVLMLCIPRGADAQKGPWWLDVTDHSALLVAETRAGELSVELTCSGEMFRATSEGTRAPDQGVVHQVELSGLPADTACSGNVEGPGLQQAISLHTAGASEPLTFLVYGDDRTNHSVHRRVVQQMLRERDARFILHTGDFVEVGGRPRDWQQFFDIAQPILKDVPLFPTLGNHEIYGPGGRRRYQRYLVRHDHRVAWQAWTWGDVRLISLDSNDEWNEGDPQHEWLQDQLAEASLDSDIAWIIVFAHQGPISSGRHGNHPRMEALGIGELLRDSGVDLVFAGHDHMYERGDDRGLKYVVTGGGGAPLYRVNRRQRAQQAFQVKHHFVRITVDDSRLEMTAIDVDGEILERCGFTRGEPWECSVRAGIDPGEPPKSRSLMWLGLVVVFVVLVGAYGWRKTRSMRR